MELTYDVFGDKLFPFVTPPSRLILRLLNYNYIGSCKQPVVTLSPAEALENVRSVAGDLSIRNTGTLCQKP